MLLTRKKTALKLATLGLSFGLFTPTWSALPKLELLSPYTEMGASDVEQELNEAVTLDDRYEEAITSRDNHNSYLIELARIGTAADKLEIGDMYYDGFRINQSYIEAKNWYEEADENGSLAAQFYLGNMYYNGEGVSKSYNRAIEWYGKAANNNYSAAQFNLGSMYAMGIGVRQDYNRAIEWLLKAANQDDAKAQYNLGAIYHNGKGIHQDIVQAKEWFGKACDNEYQEGCEMYRILNEQ